MEYIEISNTVRNFILYMPAALVLSLFIVFGIEEFLVIGVIADPEEIQRYNFGTEAMIAHGGDKYRSSNSYALASLVIGLLGITGVMGSLLFLLKAINKPLLKAYLFSLCCLLLVWFIGRAW